MGVLHQWTNGTKMSTTLMEPTYQAKLTTSYFLSFTDWRNRKLLMWWKCLWQRCLRQKYQTCFPSFFSPSLFPFPSLLLFFLSFLPPFLSFFFKVHMQCNLVGGEPMILPGSAHFLHMTSFSMFPFLKRPNTSSLDNGNGINKGFLWSICQNVQNLKTTK